MPHKDTIEEIVKEFEEVAWFSFPVDIEHAHGYKKSPNSNAPQIYDGRRENMRELLKEALQKSFHAGLQRGAEIIRNWPRGSCGCTREEQKHPDSECPGWSVEDSRARDVILEQVLHALTKEGESK